MFKYGPIRMSRLFLGSGWFAYICSPLVDVTIGQYCSKDCQQTHWSVHKGDCKSPLMKATWRPSWIVEARQPAFISGGEDGATFDMVSHGRQKYLWGNVPAFDLLDLQQNEGVDFAGDLRLLFAGGYSFLMLYLSLIPT